MSSGKTPTRRRHLFPHLASQGCPPRHGHPAPRHFQRRAFKAGPFHCPGLAADWAMEVPKQAARRGLRAKTHHARQVLRTASMTHPLPCVASPRTGCRARVTDAPIALRGLAAHRLPCKALLTRRWPCAAARTPGSPRAAVPPGSRRRHQFDVPPAAAALAPDHRRPRPLDARPARPAPDFRGSITRHSVTSPGRTAPQP